MAQMGNIRPFEKPTVEQIIADEHGRYSSRCSSPATPSPHEEDQSPHTKKSVLAKVKEKAKKWRNTLSKKKHGNDGVSSASAWGAEEDEEVDSEYHGAPMYESEVAHGGYKETSTQNPALPPIVTEKHVLKAKGAEMPESKAATEPEKDMLAPACEKKLEVNRVVDSKTQELPAIATSTTKEEHNWDKGVSVKAYLMQKLEPGEEEKALSQVISEAMSPSKTGNNDEMGVVEKVKVAVSSLLGMEEQPPKASVTINPHAEIIEEKEERRLQTNREH